MLQPYAWRKSRWDLHKNVPCCFEHILEVPDPRPLTPMRVNLRVMPMKAYSIFSKAPGPEPHRQMQFRVISGHWLRVGSSYLSAEMQLAYSTSTADWATSKEILHTVI